MLLLLLPHTKSVLVYFVQIFGQLHRGRKHEKITTANMSKSFQVRLCVCWCRPLINQWRTRLIQVPCDIGAFETKQTSCNVKEREEEKSELENPEVWRQWCKLVRNRKQRVLHHKNGPIFFTAIVLFSQRKQRRQTSFIYLTFTLSFKN